MGSKPEPEKDEARLYKPDHEAGDLVTHEGVFRTVMERDDEEQTYTLLIKGKRKQIDQRTFDAHSKSYEI